MIATDFSRTRQLVQCDTRIFAAECCKSVVPARLCWQRMALAGDGPASRRAPSADGNELGQPGRLAGSSPHHDRVPKGARPSAWRPGAGRDPCCLTNGAGNWILGLAKMHRDDASFPSFPRKREPSGVRRADETIPRRSPRFARGHRRRRVARASASFTRQRTRCV